MKFAEEMYNLAEKTRASTTDKLGTTVRGVELMEKANEEARVEAATRRLELDQRVARASKVRFAHPGVPITIREGDTKRTVMRPLEINYGHLRYVIPTNRAIEIPDFIYEHYLKEQELAAQRNRLNNVLQDGRNHINKAIAIEPAIDPTYAQRVSAGVAAKGVELPQAAPLVEGV